MDLPYTKKELEQIAKIYGLTGAYKMKKAELTDALLETIPAKMPEMLSQLDMNDITIFESLIKEDRFIYFNTEIADKEQAFAQLVYPYKTLHDLEFVQYDEKEDGVNIKVPELIKNSYANINLEELMPEIERKSELRKYLTCVLNLYGAADFGFVINLFKKCYDKVLTKEELKEMMAKDLKMVNKGAAFGDYIAEESLYQTYEENVDELIKRTEGKTYYTPSREILEKYEDISYADPCPAIDNFKRYLTRYTTNPYAIDYATTIAVLFARVDINEDATVVDLILNQIRDVTGIMADSVQEQMKYSNYINQIRMSIRKWVNKGHTDAEISPIVVNKATGQRRNLMNIGRNDMCPCGSGKKYKKCCGR